MERGLNFEDLELLFEQLDGIIQPKIPLGYLAQKKLDIVEL